MVIMPSRNTKAYSILLMVADAIILAIVFVVSYYVRTQFLIYFLYIEMLFLSLSQVKLEFLLSNYFVS